MIKVEVARRLFYVRFSYPDKRRKNHNKRLTYCHIGLVSKADNKTQVKEIAKGVAVCNSDDCYNKHIGRFIAFRNAIKDFPREVRKTFFDAFTRDCNIQKYISAKNRL